MTKRLTISETGGNQRSHSYNVDEDLPLGSWPVSDPSKTYPDEIAAELEALFQSDFAPTFCYEPHGELTVEVAETEKKTSIFEQIYATFFEGGELSVESRELNGELQQRPVLRGIWQPVSKLS